MVRYVQDGKNQGTFAKRYKNLKDQFAAANFLSTLEPNEFKHIQTVSSHFGGNINKLSEHLPEFPKKKIRPSTWDYIAQANSPHELNMGLVAELRGHNHPAIESHMGGGLLDGINTIGHLLWNFHPGVMGYHWIKDKLGFTQKNKISQLQHYDADTLEQAYADIGDRESTLNNGWTLVPDYETDYTSVYRNPKNGSLHVAIRGSKTAHDWLYHDALILARNKPGDEKNEDIQKFLVDLAKENPNADLTINSHSLSGSFVQNAFTEANPTQEAWLDHYSTINLFNPGSNSFANTDSIHEFASDDRVYMFLNSTDPISQGYARAVNSENQDRVYWGTPTYYPIGAHTYAQWMDDPSAPTPSTDDLGEPIPEPTEHNDNWTTLSNKINELHSRDSES